jgi:LacI family transcriptional regulator
LADGLEGARFGPKENRLSTIVEVASVAGVSLKSVSRVMNNGPNVSARLRARVEAAIKEVGYVPNAAARSLASSRTYAIGVQLYTHADAVNPSPNYPLKILEGAFSACRKRGYNLVMEQLDLTTPGQTVQDLERTIDGLILTPPSVDDGMLLDALEAQGLPYVRISPTLFPGRSPAVSMDDFKAGATVAQHLVSLGHRRLGLVGGPDLHRTAALRREGFLDTAAALSAQIVEVPGHFDFHSGVGAGLNLLSQAERPSAIFAVNDDSAVGVVAAANQLGLKIPADVSVVGFDDSWISQCVWPELTTIHQPIAEMARAAAELLIDHLNGVSARSLTLPYRLMVRGSTAPRLLGSRD